MHRIERYASVGQARGRGGIDLTSSVRFELQVTSLTTFVQRTSYYLSDAVSIRLELE